MSGKRWHWRCEPGLSRGMELARQCRLVWHIRSPLPGFNARLFVYRDGEVTLYRGKTPDGPMDFEAGASGRQALRLCLRELRKLWAFYLARKFAELEPEDS